MSVVKSSDCVLEENPLAQQSSMAWMRTAVTLGMGPAAVSVMSRPPRDLKMPNLDRFDVLLVLRLGTYHGLASLWLFHHYFAIHGEEGLLLAQTPALTASVLIEKANVWNFRSLNSPLFRVGFFQIRGAWLPWSAQCCCKWRPCIFRDCSGPRIPLHSGGVIGV